MALVHGYHFGPHLATLQWHVPFSCTVVAFRLAQEGANATAPVSDAQPFANVKASV